VQIGAGTTVAEHVVIRGRTRIGTGNRIWQFNSIGEGPQDKRRRQACELVIGDDNTIRDSARSIPAPSGRGTNRWQPNWIMAYVRCP
jgi:UDP-N-acetylglucosamine acyltransferase